MALMTAGMKFLGRGGIQIGLQRTERHATKSFWVKDLKVREPRVYSPVVGEK